MMSSGHTSLPQNQVGCGGWGVGSGGWGVVPGVFCCFLAGIKYSNAARKNRLVSGALKHLPPIANFSYNLFVLV